jgi:DNA processing protein
MEPVYEPRERIEAARQRPLEAALQGLWCCGRLDGLARICVAVVGTRAATAQGRRIAGELAAGLGRAGCCILSGLALGIDAAAHEGALCAGTPTIGVLGGGHHPFYPPRNRALAARMIAAGGAVLSPFPPDRPAHPPQFLARNGVVAALADAVVVVEAPARSGALNTAGWAAGRIPVLAVPGDVDRPQVQGCLALIRDGALLARHAGDVLEALGLSGRPSEGAPAREPRDPLDRRLLQALAEESALDDLAAACALPPSAVLARLSLLELEGMIERRAGSRYARVLP